MECLLYKRSTKEITAGNVDLVEQWSTGDDLRIWIHITGELTKPIQDILRTRFGIHRLALQDASRDRHPPKVEEFEGHTFLIFKTLTAATTDTSFSTLQSIMFVGERFLITRTSERCPTIEQLWEKERTTPMRLGKGPEAIACRLMRLSIDRYLEILLQLEAELEGLEGGLLDRVDDAVLAEVTGYKANLKRLRRIFLYHEQMLREMRASTHHGFGRESVHELNDVYEQQERASSLTLLYYELASDLIDGYLSLASHRLNQIMKVLTVVSPKRTPVWAMP